MVVQKKLVFFSVFLSLFFLLPLYSFSLPEKEFKNYKKTLDFGLKSDVLSTIEYLQSNFKKSDQTQIETLLKIPLKNNLDPEVLKAIFIFISQKKLSALAPQIMPLLKEINDTASLTQLIRTLGNLKYKASQNALRTMFDKPNLDPPIKSALIFSLGLLQDKTMVKPLMNILEHPMDNKNFVSSALIALNDIKDPSCIDPLIKILDTSDLDDSDKALIPTILSNFKDPKINNWLNKNLQESNSAIKISILKAISKLGLSSPAFNKEVITALKSDDVKLRTTAIEVLPTSSYGKKIEYLKYSLKNGGMQDQDEMDTAIALEKMLASTFLKINYAQATAYFKKIFPKSDSITQYGIIQALKSDSIKEKSVYQTLFMYFYKSQNNPQVRKALVQTAASDIRVQSAYDFLKALAKNESLGGLPDSTTQDRIDALAFVTKENYQDIFPYLQSLLKKPQKNPLFKSASQLILMDPKGETFLISLIPTMDPLLYNSTQRGDLFLLLAYTHAKQGKQIFIDAYKKETDPQTKFAIKRILTQNYSVVMKDS